MITTEDQFKIEKTIRQVLIAPQEATTLELVTQLAKVTRNLDERRIENLDKWRRLIECGLSVDQPELLIMIDIALESIPKLQDALAFMVNNYGNPRSPEAYLRYKAAQELVSERYLKDPRNARVGPES